MYHLQLHVTDRHTYLATVVLSTGIRIDGLPNTYLCSDGLMVGEIQEKIHLSWSIDFSFLISC